MYIFGGVLNFLGLFTRRFSRPPCDYFATNANFLKVLTYIDLSATTVGISPEFSFYLVSIANAGSGLGRISSGFFADKLGPVTVTAPLTLLCAIMTYVWPFATSKGALVAIAVIYGFCSGAYVSLLPVPVVMMGDMHDAGRRTGIVMTVVALGAIAGPPISGAIAEATDGFEAVGYYAGTVPSSLPPTLDLLLKMSSSASSFLSGSCILGAVVFLYLTKYLMLGSLRGKF